MCVLSRLKSLNSALYKSYHELQSRLVSIVSEKSLKSRQELPFACQELKMVQETSSDFSVDLNYGHSKQKRLRN